MNPPLAVEPDGASFVAAAAERIERALTEAVRERGRAAIALAGGSTPRAVYERLAGPPHRGRIDWPRVEVFFGDERAVPPDDPESNHRMAREALLSRVPIRDGSVHRLEGERADLEAAAHDAEAELLRALGGSRTAPPVLDLVLLGLGEDGHTASIFPDVVERCRGPELYVAVDSRAKGRRLTATLPLLDSARRVLFLVRGTGKREVLARWRALPEPDPGLPASLVRPTRGELLVLCDRDAAG